jgi:hypothetical protein
MKLTKEKIEFMRNHYSKIPINKLDVYSDEWIHGWNKNPSTETQEEFYHRREVNLLLIISEKLRRNEEEYETNPIEKKPKTSKKKSSRNLQEAI